MTLPTGVRNVKTRLQLNLEKKTCFYEENVRIQYLQKIKEEGCLNTTIFEKAN